MNIPLTTIFRIIIAFVLLVAAGQFSGSAQFIVFFLFLWSFMIAFGVRAIHASLAVAILLLPFEIGWGTSIPTAVVEGFTGWRDISVWFIITYADVLFVGLFFLLFFFSRKDRPRPIPIDSAIAVFFGWSLISTIASSYQPAAAAGFLTLSRGILVYAVARHLARNKRVDTLVTMCFAAILLFEGALGLYQLHLGGLTGRFFETSQVTILPDEAFRPTGTMNDPNYYALVLLMLLPPVVLHLFRAQSVYRRLYYFFGALFGTIGIIVSGGRLAWISLALYSIFLWKSYKNILIHYVHQRFYYPRGNVVMVLGTIMMLFYLYPKIIAPRLSGIPGTLSSRWMLLQESVSSIMRHPVLGSGLNSFTADAALFPSTDIFRGFAAEVHNVYLLIASELGFVGLLLFLLIIRKFFIMPRSVYSGGIILYLLFGLMIPSFIRGSQFPLFMLLLGLHAK